VEVAQLTVGSTTIFSKRAIKYLGDMIDTRLTFREHLEYIHKKFADLNRALRFGQDTTDECPSCRPGIVEDAQHFVFQCEGFTPYRQRLEEVMGGTITEANLEDRLFESIHKWEAARSVAAAIMIELRREERIRRGSPSIL